MPGDSPANTPSAAELRARLQEVRRLVGDSSHLDPAAQAALTELVDELTEKLQTDRVPPRELTSLIATTADLAESLHQQADEGIVEEIRDNLEASIIKAEAQHPTAVGLARQLLDVLANIGI